MPERLVRLGQVGRLVEQKGARDCPRGGWSAGGALGVRWGQARFLKMLVRLGRRLSDRRAEIGSGHRKRCSCEGFRMPAGCDVAGSAEGRRPKASKEGTRGPWRAALARGGRGGCGWGSRRQTALPHSRRRCHHCPTDSPNVGSRPCSRTKRPCMTHCGASSPHLGNAGLRLVASGRRSWHDEEATCITIDGGLSQCVA
jgi:hypothetical protein